MPVRCLGDIVGVLVQHGLQVVLVILASGCIVIRVIAHGEVIFYPGLGQGQRHLALGRLHDVVRQGQHFILEAGGIDVRVDAACPIVKGSIGRLIS